MCIRQGRECVCMHMFAHVLCKELKEPLMVIIPQKELRQEASLGRKFRFLLFKFS